MDEAADLSVQIQLIKKQPLFSNLTDKEIEELASLLSEQNIISGETIVKEGDAVDSVYLIANGTADVRATSYKDNKPVVSSVAILSTGDSIGLNETGFYSISGKRTASVIAMTDMTLYRLSVAAFHGFALSHSHVSEIMHSHAENILIDKPS